MVYCTKPPEADLEMLAEGTLLTAGKSQATLAKSNHKDRSVPRLLQMTEKRVEEMIILLRKENPVRILVKESAVIAEGVILHAETRLDGVEHRVHVHFLFSGLPHHALIGSKAKVQGAQVYAVGRSYQPQQTQHGKDAKEKNKNLLRFHRNAKVRILFTKKKMAAKVIFFLLMGKEKTTGWRSPCTNRP